jgi:adenine phosphoribosyltransferase
MSQELASLIRDVPDFPKEGIVFKDITTLLKEPEAIRKAGELLLGFAKDLQVDVVVGIESRGFMFGMFLAQNLNVGFVPVRKPGKLPSQTISYTYDLEYGSDTLEIHTDAIRTGQKVLIHDDLLATGGTAEAACKLVEKAGGEVIQLSFLVELTFLNGRDKLSQYDVKAIIQY